jgi:hypothetical protein
MPRPANLLPKWPLRYIRAAERANTAPEMMRVGRCCAFIRFQCGLHLFQRFRGPRQQALWEWCGRQGWTIEQLDLAWRLICVGNSPVVLEPVREAGCGQLIVEMVATGALPEDTLV